MRIAFIIGIAITVLSSCKKDDDGNVEITGGKFAKIRRFTDSNSDPKIEVNINLLSSMDKEVEVGLLILRNDEHIAQDSIEVFDPILGANVWQYYDKCDQPYEQYYQKVVSPGVARFVIDDNASLFHFFAVQRQNGTDFAGNSHDNCIWWFDQFDFE